MKTPTGKNKWLVWLGLVLTDDHCRGPFLAAPRLRADQARSR